MRASRLYRPDYMNMTTKYKGENIREPHHCSPYPLSRLSPGMELVELARETSDADDALTLQATAQLRLLAEQVEELREKARKILVQTRENQELHRARCSFSRKAGQSYHLYRKKSGSLVFSMIAPDEWTSEPPFVFVGTYLLQADKTWKKIDANADRCAV